MVRHDDKDQRKTTPVSAPFLSEAAAKKYASLCEKQGWRVSVVAK